MHGANSHHLSDAETVSKVVEWIASVVLLNGNLQQRYNNNSQQAFSTEIPFDVGLVCFDVATGSTPNLCPPVVP